MKKIIQDLNNWCEKVRSAPEESGVEQELFVELLGSIFQHQQEHLSKQKLDQLANHTSQEYNRDYLILLLDLSEALQQQHIWMAENHDHFQAEILKPEHRNEFKTYIDSLRETNQHLSTNTQQYKDYLAEIEDLQEENQKLSRSTQDLVDLHKALTQHKEFLLEIQGQIEEQNQKVAQNLKKELETLKIQNNFNWETSHEMLEESQQEKVERIRSLIFEVEKELSKIIELR